MTKIGLVLIGAAFVMSCSSKESSKASVEEQTVTVKENDEVGDVSFWKSKERLYEYHTDSESALERLTRDLVKELFLEEGIDMDFMLIGVHIEDDKEHKVLKLRYNIAAIGEMSPSELAIAMVAKGLNEEEVDKNEVDKKEPILELVCISDDDKMLNYSFIVDKKDAVNTSAIIEQFSLSVKRYMEKVCKEEEKCEVRFVLQKDLDKEEVKLKKNREYIEKEYIEYTDMFARARSKVLEDM